MFGPLTIADFPLSCIGRNVYAVTRSSPILVATDDQMAADIVMRLNREHLQAIGGGANLGGQGPMAVVYGR